MTRKLILFLLVAIPALLAAQEVSFTAQAPRQIAMGQRFYLTYTINAETRNFVGPEIQHFNVLGGPSKSVSSNISNINGKYEVSNSESYTFVLEANEAGTFTIPQAVASANSKKYMSNSLTITVINPGPGKNQPQARSNQPQRQAQQQTGEDPGNDIFLKAAVDKNNPYQGEQITVTYKLYTRTNRLQVAQPEKIPSYPGFWSQDLLKDATQYPQYSEVINGKKYIVAELRKAALFPQKSGTLTIDPLVQNVVYQIKVKARNPFGDDPFFGNDPFFKNMLDDSFFGSEYQNVQKKLTSGTVSINVKPLPAANRPPEFTGAVGQFTLKAVADKTQLSANDAFTLRVSVSGNGNMNLIEKPAINFPPDFEVYDPKIIDNFKSDAGTSGTRTFEYLVIPRAAGDFTIDPVQFAYFDPVRKNYNLLTSDNFKLKVTKGTGSSTADNATQGSVKYLGNDIRYLMATPLNLHPAGNTFYGSALYWLLLLLPVIGFTAFVVLWRRNLKLKGDTKLMQRRKATRIAVKRLQKAKKLLDAGSHDAFHEEIAFALWGYISDKFNIPMSELSMDTAREQLESRNVKPELTEIFMNTLNDCNYTRYAPPGKALNMQQLYELAIQAITETEHQLR